MPLGGLVLVCIGTACCPCLAGHCRQKCPIWPQEKHFLFVESFPLGLISLFLFSLGEAPPEEVFSKEQALYIVHASASKAPLFQKTLYLPQPQAVLPEALGAKWRTPGPWEAPAEVVVVALNQTVVDKFLKVCVEWEGARQGAQPQLPVSPLLPREVEHSLPPFLSQWQNIWGSPLKSEIVG